MSCMRLKRCTAESAREEGSMRVKQVFHTHDAPLIHQKLKCDPLCSLRFVRCSSVRSALRPPLVCDVHEFYLLFCSNVLSGCAFFWCAQAANLTPRSVASTATCLTMKRNSFAVQSNKVVPRAFTTSVRPGLGDARHLLAKRLRSLCCSTRLLCARRPCVTVIIYYIVDFVFCTRCCDRAFLLSVGALLGTLSSRMCSHTIGLFPLALTRNVYLFI
jgi:hypothetical protein